MIADFTDKSKVTERTHCIGSWRQLTMLDKSLPRTRTAARRTLLAFVAIFALLNFASNIYAASSAASPDLIKLEREVSLTLAHAHDQGYTDKATINRVAEAHRIDLEGEKAIASGDYHKAEDDFLKAKALLYGLDKGTAW